MAIGPGPCPICGSSTLLKTNTHLSIPFYGCIEYPHCKGSRDYDESLVDRTTAETKNKPGDNKMMNMGNINDKMMDRFFKKVDGVVWDLMSGKVGIQSVDGISTLEGEGEDAQVSLNLIEQFGMPIPAFAQSTPIDQVKVGNLIYVNGKPKGWVISIKSKASAEPAEGEEAKINLKKFVVMSPNGSSGTWTPPKVSMLGLDSGVMVLKSLMEMLPGGETGLSGMQGSLMPLMMMGGDMGDMDKIMPMMLMSQMGTMGGGAGGGNNMIQMMMMMKMMGGKSGKSGGGGFFD